MIFTRQDHERLDAILREAARREVMPRFRRLAAGDIRAKQNPVDVVTEADEAAERFICTELAKAFPGAALIGEEAVTQDPPFSKSWRKPSSPSSSIRSTAR